MWVKNIGMGLLWLCFGVTASMARQTDGLPKDSLKMGQQIPVTYYNRIEPTESEKYVIVYKDSLCGIYDIKGLCNVTDIKYTDLRMRDRRMSDEGTVTVFVYACGKKTGLISLCEANNEYVSIEL